jgi:signal transduction histidine kinase
MTQGAGEARHDAAPVEKPTLPKLLSLTVHEFRSPLTVVAGYIRMLLKDRAGPLSDQQRHLLEEAEKSCGRMSTLLSEVSELAHLEAGTAPFNRSAVDVLRVLRELVGELPPLPDREVTIEVDGVAADVNADAVRLKAALGSILLALRRELVSTDRIAVRVHRSTDGADNVVRITVAEASHLDGLLVLDPSALSPFDEWRGGNGLSLANARRVIEAHGGRIFGSRDGVKTFAAILLPAVRG